MSMIHCGKVVMQAVLSNPIRNTDCVALKIAKACLQVDASIDEIWEEAKELINSQLHRNMEWLVDLEYMWQQTTTP